MLCEYEPLAGSGFGKTVVKGNERDRLSQLVLEEQATRELHGVAGTQWMPSEEAARAGGDLRSNLDYKDRPEIVVDAPNPDNARRLLSPRRGAGSCR